jgi:type VI secretion system protein VasD
MTILGMRSFRLATGALIAVLIAGCGAPPKPPPSTEVTGVLRAAPNVNPSVGKRPSPLLVRIYELKSVAAFNNADFVSLYQRDQAELGADIVGREEVILNPGDSHPISKLTAPETRFVGVFAAYRDLDHAKWRGVLAIQPGQKQRILISAEELSISAVFVK